MGSCNKKKILDIGSSLASALFIIIIITRRLDNILRADKRNELGTGHKADSKRIFFPFSVEQDENF